MNSVIEEVAGQLTDTKRFIMQSGFDTSKGSVFAFLFDKDSPSPRYFLKIARAVDSVFLDIEFKNLTYIQSKINSEEINLPKANSYMQVKRHEVIVFDYFDGSRLSAVYNNMNRERQMLLLKKISQWLCRFHLDTKQTMNKSLFDELIRGPVQSFINNENYDESQKLKAAQSLEVLENNYSDIFVAFEHGDVQGNNILVGKNNSLCLLDWESGTKIGFPAIDLFHLFLKQGLLKNRAMMNFLTEYCHCINMPVDVVPSLYIVFLIRRHPENLLQREKTLLFDQEGLLSMINSVELKYSF